MRPKAKEDPRAARTCSSRLSRLSTLSVLATLSSTEDNGHPFVREFSADLGMLPCAAAEVVYFPHLRRPLLNTLLYLCTAGAPSTGFAVPEVSGDGSDDLHLCNFRDLR